MHPFVMLMSFTFILVVLTMLVGIFSIGKNPVISNKLMRLRIIFSATLVTEIIFYVMFIKP